MERGRRFPSRQTIHKSLPLIHKPTQFTHLTTRSIAHNAPKPLGAKRRPTILHPRIIEGGVKDQIILEGPFERLDRGLLILHAGNGLAIRIASRGPPTLRHDDRFLGRFGDLLDPAQHELAGIGSGDFAVEEGVAVDGTVVGGGAEADVVFHGDHGVDSDDGAVVSGGFEERAGLGDGGGDLVDGGFAVVDELVADADGVDAGPVAVDGVDEGLGFGGDFVDVEDAGEELDGLAFGGGQYIADLRAVGPVEAENLVAGYFGQVLADLGRAFAAVVGVVGRVGDAIAEAGSLGRTRRWV